MDGLNGVIIDGEFFEARPVNDGRLSCEYCGLIDRCDPCNKTENLCEYFLEEQYRRPVLFASRGEVMSLKTKIGYAINKQ